MRRAREAQAAKKEKKAALKLKRDMKKRADRMQQQLTQTEDVLRKVERLRASETYQMPRLTPEAVFEEEKLLQKVAEEEARVVAAAAEPWVRTEKVRAVDPRWTSAFAPKPEAWTRHGRKSAFGIADTQEGVVYANEVNLDLKV